MCSCHCCDILAWGKFLWSNQSWESTPMRKCLNLQYMYLKILTIVALYWTYHVFCWHVHLFFNMIHFIIFRTCGMVRDGQWWLAVILSESGPIQLHTQRSHDQPPAGRHRDQPHDGAVARITHRQSGVWLDEVCAVSHTHAHTGHNPGTPRSYCIARPAVMK